MGSWNGEVEWGGFPAAARREQGPQGPPSDSGSPSSAPGEALGRQKARTRQPWPLLSSNTAAAERGQGHG